MQGWRRSTAIGVLLASGLVCPAPSVAAPAQEAPRFPGGVERVRLDVVVIDGAGRPVEGLTAADFAVDENGRPRRIETFEPIVVRLASAPATTASGPTLAATPLTFAPDQGRCVLVLLDDVHLAASTAQQLRFHLVPFLQRELREGDWVTLVAPHAHVWWTARTAWERAQLPAILNRIGGQYLRDPFRTHVSDFDAMQEVERQPSGPHGGSLASGDVIGSRSLLVEEVYAVARRRISATLSQLREAVASLAGFRGHKSLVLYSQGFILAPRFPEFEQVIEAARRANVAVHFLDPRGMQSTCFETGGGEECDNSLTGWMKSAAGAVSLAEATGGRDSRLNDPVSEVRRILEESQAYYLIGYAPLEGGPAQRKVRARVLRDGLKVLARTRYVVLRPEQLKAKTAPEVEALRSVSDATDLPIRAEVQPSGPEAPDRAVRTSEKEGRTAVAVPITVELDGQAGASEPRRLSL
ncbi:MAG TPA: VWA domain-containing protein, partial [Vicinamibacteria bacterium]|nr:VWA domain-containing protein [Vicinamibacteria bacterium]